MLELHAGPFLRTRANLASIRGAIEAMMSSTEIDPSQYPIVKGDPGPLPPGVDLDDLENDLRNMGLDVALVTLEKLKLAFVPRENGTFDGRNVSRLIQELEGRIIDSLNSKHFLFLSPREESFFRPKSPLFGDDVARKFPTISYDIEESGKCIALGRSTASAFHSLRCLEGAIRAISRSLGIPDPTKGSQRNWSVMLKSIQSEIDRRWPKPSRLSGDGIVFEQLHAILSAMQNPYRNATMHLDQKYTESEADHIFVMVRGLMEKVASRVDENGDPKA